MNMSNLLVSFTSPTLFLITSPHLYHVDNLVGELRHVKIYNSNFENNVTTNLTTIYCKKKKKKTHLILS